MTMNIASVTFDCHDAAVTAEFWACAAWGAADTTCTSAGPSWSTGTRRSASWTTLRRF